MSDTDNKNISPEEKYAPAISQAVARYERLKSKAPPPTPLNLEEACEQGDLDAVRKLHAEGADITVDDNYAVRVAAEKGHLDVVRYLHEHGADLTARNNEAVYLAAPHGHLEMVRYLHENGADITAVDNQAMCGAARKGHLEVIKYLHENGADITAQDNEAVYLAAKNGHLDVVKYLYEQGADITEKVNYALRDAALNGHLDVVKYLYEQGADITARDNQAMRCAAAGGHLDVVRYLHENSADITARDNNVLNNPVSNGHLDVVKYLHEHGANLTNVRGQRLIDAAGRGHLDVVRYLHENGVNIMAWSNAVLLKAAKIGHLEMVRYLHENGADLTARDHEALRLAARNGHLEMVRYLHEHGADITARDNTAVYVAAQNGHLDVVKYLHEHGADITEEYNTAGDNYVLHVAAANGHLDVVRYLHEHGVDITARDNYVVKLTANNGYLDIVKYLHEHGADLTINNNEILKRSALEAVSRNHSYYELVSYLIDAGAPIEILPATQQDSINAYRSWQKRHGACPKGLVDSSPHYFRPKVFYPVRAVLEKEGYIGEIASQYAYNAAALFKTPDRFWRYVEKWAGFSDKQPVHDAIQDIKIPQEGRFDLTAWGDACLKFGPKMTRLVKFADQFPTPMKDEKGGWSYTLTRNEIAKHAYKKAHEAPELAKLCFEVNYTNSGFELALKTMEKHTKAVERAIENSKKYPFTRVYKENQVLPNSQIPDIRIDGEAFDKPGYVLRKLESGDIKGLLLGAFTSCCQHIAGEGSECAEHGFLSPYGGFYVVEKQETGEITGQSWVWRGRGGELVLDSFESLKGHFTAASVEKICLEIEKTTLSKDQEEKQNFWKPINGVFLGTDGGTPDLLPRYKSSAPVKPKDYLGYRDSRQQYQVSKFERDIG